MVVMVWPCFGLILVMILLSSLLKMLIAVAFIHNISKSDAIHLLENYVLDERGYKQNTYQRNQY